jgi:uncharacterized membrane protein YgcG
MNLDNFFKPPQKGGPSEKETQDFLDSLIKKEELPPSATLADLVKHVREEQKKWDWTGIRDIVLAVVVGWIAAEFFIPPIMKHFVLDILWGPAIAFVVGYCGIRLLPLVEERAKKFVKGDK